MLLAIAMRSCEGNLGKSSFDPPGPIVDQKEDKIEEELISVDEPEVIPNRQHDYISTTYNDNKI